MLWPHCANSPPSQISTVSGSRSTKGRNARNTSAGCRRPGVCETMLRHAAGRLSRAARALGKPAVVARLAIAGARDQRLGRGLASATQPSSSRVVLLVAGALDQRRRRDRSRSAAPPDRTPGPATHLVVKSSALPSSTIRSARSHEIGKCAERGVGDAARAFHDHRGRADGGLELREQRATRSRSRVADRQ